MKPLFIGYDENGEHITLTDEDLKTHLHGIGASRTGKSKMIEWIARELIRRQDGFCLIDPHGFLYEDLVRWLAYLKPDREIILFNPSSENKIVGFNPFLGLEGDVSTLADRRVRATLKVWGANNANDTPRLERWLRSVYYVLIEQGLSLEAARYLFSFKTKIVREYLTKNISSSLIKNEFEELAEVSKLRDFMEQIESTRNRLFRFLLPQQIRRTMGLDHNNINIKDIIERGQILLVNLQPSDKLETEHARLIGTLLLNEFWEVAKRRRQQIGGTAPDDFFLIIDEFQMFLTPDVPEMLDQGAKYGIHMMLFHQRLSQLKELDPNAYGAVNNAQVKLVYGGLSDEDATLMAREIFAGQIDLKRIKFFIEQTKFWPEVGRAKVYQSGKSWGKGKSTTSGWGSTEGGGTNTGMSYAWLDDGTTYFDGKSNIETQSSSGADTNSESEGWNEGEADVPFIYPKAFTEVSSITPYSLEEQLWELASALRNQYQRHFMIRRPGKPTVAGVTPFVKPYFTAPEDVDAYLNTVLKSFLLPAEVDRALDDIHAQLALAAGVTKQEIEIEETDSDNVWEKP